MKHLKKFNESTSSGNLTVSDIGEFFLDFVDDRFSISDLIKLEPVEYMRYRISSKYSKGYKVRVMYVIDDRFKKLDKSNIGLFNSFLACVSETCDRWNLQYMIDMAKFRLIILKDIPEPFLRWLKSNRINISDRNDITVSGEGSVELNTAGYPFKFALRVNVDENLQISVDVIPWRIDRSVFFGGRDRIPEIVAKNKDEIKSSIEGYFKSQGLDGEVTIKSDEGGKSFLFKYRGK